MKKIFMILAIFATCLFAGCTGNDWAEMNYNREAHAAKFQSESGVDYVLVGTNEINWISENKPDTGEGYSVIYKVYPTYTVVRNIPQLRSSENQRFPKKAVVKLMSSYSEMRGVNRQ